MTKRLDDIPKKNQAEASELLTQMLYEKTRASCEKMRDEFIRRFKKVAPKATEKIMVDWDRLVPFYSYPEEHRIHLRTTNIVESPFNAIRLRTNAAKRFKKVENAGAMIWKLMQVAEKTFRKLNAPELMERVYRGERFDDGLASVEVTNAA